MHMGEEDAFAVLIHTTYRCGFRATFLPDMDQLQARLYQLTQLVQEALPQLDAHMEELGIRPVRRETRPSHFCLLPPHPFLLYPLFCPCSIK